MRMRPSARSKRSGSVCTALLCAGALTKKWRCLGARCLCVRVWGSPPRGLWVSSSTTTSPKLSDAFTEELEYASLFSQPQGDNWGPTSWMPTDSAVVPVRQNNVGKARIYMNC